MIENSTKTAEELSFDKQVNQLLIELTLQLKARGLWNQDKPNAGQLTSTAPFCCDTLTFEQWLQFVFIIKITDMMSKSMPLPTNIALKPMAEESFKSIGCESVELINVLAKIDQLLSAAR